MPDPNRSGPVTFLDGTAALCSNVSLSSGSATCTTTTLTLGQHNVTASYAGDTNNASSVSAVLVQVVKYQPSLVLSVSPNPATVTQSVTVTLTATAPTGTPSGTAVLFDGSTQLTTISLNGSGVATYSTTQLAPGQHNLYAQYAGDASDSAGQSNALNEVVNQISTTTILASTSSTVYVGAPVTFTAAVSNRRWSHSEWQYPFLGRIYGAWNDTDGQQRQCHLDALDSCSRQPFHRRLVYWRHGQLWKHICRVCRDGAADPYNNGPSFRHESSQRWSYDPSDRDGCHRFRRTTVWCHRRQASLSATAP